MKTKIRTTKIQSNLTLLLTALGILCGVNLGAAPVGSAFTYQGKLSDGGAPANGVYDFQFELRAAPDGGGASVPVLLEDVAVTNGLFTVQLDFGTNAFNAGARWLEIGVRAGASAGGFTGLLPRQPITAAPVAQHALNAAVADYALSGNPGPQGPAGPASIVGSGFVAGTTAYPTNTLRFLALPVTVTITAPGQRVYVSASRALGGYDLGAKDLGLHIAYRNVNTPAAAPTTVSLGIYGVRVPPNTRVPMSLSGIITNLAVGTYHVGMAGQDDGLGRWTNSEWGHTSALVFTQP
jgi:hypothetical protein